MCHDTKRESFEHRVILFIPLLQFIKTSDLKTLVAFEGAERSGSFHSASVKPSLAVWSRTHLIYGYVTINPRCC